MSARVCLLGRTRLATPREYHDLMRELERDPYCYRLVIRKRQTPQMCDRRRAAEGET